MLIGIQKPQIVLPDRKYAEEELAFAKTLHWFNPAVFWMERQAVQDMELLCDGCVVRHFSREEKKAIWRGAVKLCFREKNRMAVLCTSEFSRDVRTLKERFANIFSGVGTKRGIFAVAFGVVLLLSASLFVMFGASQNGDEKGSQNPGNTASENMNKGDEKNGETGTGGEEEKESPKGEQNVRQGDPQLGDDSLFSGLNTYTWQEITVSIPDAWEGKYQELGSEDGFALMQKASYEKHEGMGMLCGFYRTEGMLMDYAGATPLAFTDTRIYYMTEPTDVNYDYEDEEIAREYKAGGRPGIRGFGSGRPGRNNYYLGSVSGFPFEQQTGRSRFTVGNYVIGESRMDFTHNNRVYDSWWYDVDGQKLVHEDGGYYSIVPEGPHALSEDITVYQEMDETHMKNVLPAQDQFFSRNGRKRMGSCKGERRHKRLYAYGGR